MGKVLVSGLVNTEIAVDINAFPVAYAPIEFSCFGINTNVSGVGINLSKALKTLGDEVELLSYIGQDYEGDNILKELECQNMGYDYIKRELKSTSQSIVLYDEAGRRKIYCDLKDLQDKVYPVDEKIESLLNQVDAALICNINFSRPLLKRAKALGKLIVTDVHVVGEIDDPYNMEFMDYADVLFLSNENIKGSVRDFVYQLKETYPCKMIIVGMGKEGALLYVREEDRFEQFPAITVRTVVNTVGAGDALLSSFIHFYIKDGNPYTALKKAITFAAYKIGESGAAKGFLDEKSLLELYKKTVK